jgi:hypothetical protein
MYVEKVSLELVRYLRGWPCMNVIYIILIDGFYDYCYISFLVGP